MLNAKHDREELLQPLMVWVDLWPQGIQPPVKGWSEQLQPGISVVVDESGEEAQQWLAVLAGHAVPGRGRVQCAGLCSQLDSAAYVAQVYWHHPRTPMHEREMSAQLWLQEVAQRWPTWSEVAWGRHCQGFGLEEHLSKPLWHLSTGCLRKLGIAAALASGARLTLIEEPVAALDRSSIRYLCQALDALGEELASAPQSPRWIMVAHWEPLAGVTWDEVLAPPSLANTAGEPEANAQTLPVQQDLL